MNDFFTWIGTICAAAGLCTLVYTLVGKSATGKVFYLLSGAVMVCVMLSLPASFSKGFTLPQLTVEATENTLYEATVAQIRQQTEIVLLREVNEALESHGYTAEKVEVDMDISSENVISITDIRVYVPIENVVEQNWAEQIVSNHLGREIMVVNGG